MQGLYSRTGSHLHGPRIAVCTAVVHYVRSFQDSAIPKAALGLASTRHLISAGHLAIVHDCITMLNHTATYSLTSLTRLEPIVILSKTTYKLRHNPLRSALRYDVAALYHRKRSAVHARSFMNRMRQMLPTAFATTRSFSMRINL